MASSVWDGQGDNEGPGLDVRTRAEHMVRQIDTVNSNEELVQALGSLKRTLLDPKEESSTSSSSTSSSWDSLHGSRSDPTGAQLRQAIASTLLRRSISSGSGGANKIQEALHELLFDGCGVSHSLLAAMEVLVASATVTDETVAAASPVKPVNMSRGEDSAPGRGHRAPLFPEEALTIVSLVLVRSEARLVALLNDLPIVAQPRRADGASNKEDSDLEEQRASFLGAWCGRVVLFSRVIANACRVRRHPLPRWAVASSSGWEPRIVDCAIRACCLRQIHEASDAENTGATRYERESFSIELSYLRGLLHVLLSRGGGGSGADGAAIGIQRAYDSYRLGSEKNEATICRSVVHALLSNIPCHARRKRQAKGRSFSSLQLAPLCRALFLLELRTNEGNPPNGSDNENGSDRAGMEPWQWTIVRALLASSRDSQDLFVQQVLLAPSVPLDAATRLARLIHSVQRGDGMTGIDSSLSSESDDSSSDENDSEAESEQRCDSLLRQVHRVAVLWSTAQANGIQMHQQHALTCFLQESIKLLSDASSSPATAAAATDLATSASSRRVESPGDGIRASPDHVLLDALTSNDSLLTLMNGVSERLQSTNPRVRRDGMLIGQAVGEHVLHQSVVFDELKAQESESNMILNDCHDRPSSSRSEITLSSKRRIRQRRRTCTHPPTDPDALYVSDSESKSEGSAGDEVDSTGGWSDDSDWDEDQYKSRRYDVDDDEEDLREVQLPLYLQDCLDLLRTSETVEGAVASHLAALQALPKLVRDRPGDLADFGPLIAKQLVVMENKFHLDDFDTMVLQPLCALVAEEPLTVANALIEDMFRDGSLYNRTLALTALNEGAWELSGNARQRRDETTHLLPLQGPRMFGKRSLVSFGSEGATRRWGRSRVDKAPVMIENLFATVAPTWFYGMLRTFWDRVGDSSLWSGHVGSLFLTSFIQTLSVIVESCGPHQPVSQMLAKDLLALVWNFRNAEVAEVRTSVLIAVGTSLAILSEDSILLLLLDSGSSPSVADLPQYLHLTSANDTDPQCRALAGNIALTISSHVTSLGL